MLIGKLFYTWTPQAATPASAEVVDDNTMKIDYAVSVPDDPKKTPEQNAKAKADAEGITLSALCTTGDNRVKIVYTLVSPKVRPDGMMMEILGQDGTAKKPNYEATVWKVRPLRRPALSGQKAARSARLRTGTKPSGSGCPATRAGAAAGPNTAASGRTATAPIRRNSISSSRPPTSPAPTSRRFSATTRFR